MTFDYNPDEAKEGTFSCLPNGEYEVEIVNVEDKISKSSGNPMLELTLIAYGDEGEEVRVFDYIVNPSTLWKLKSICRCCDIDFDGTLEEQLLEGKRMRAELKVRPATEKYPEKNQVSKYVSGVAVKNTTPKSAIPKGDEPPF